MKNYTRFLIAILFCFITITLTSQNNITEKVTKRLDSLFTELNKYGEFNGNVLIAKNGKVDYSKSYGIADYENSLSLKTNSVFYLASVSKQFTAMAILLLAKDNKLTYEDDISKHLPELDYYKGIKIKNLIYHTSGLPYYIELFENYDNGLKTVTNEDVIKRLNDKTPEVRFVPGVKYEYSNTGYLLLASIIERITNQTFGDFLEKRIFKPLKMMDTRLLFNDKDKIKLNGTRIAKAYYKDFYDSDYVKKFDGTYGQSKIYSTVQDLFKWDKALKNNTLISQKDKDFVFTSGKLSSGEDIGYGFGWNIDTIEPFKKMVYHSGNWPGYITYIERHLDNNLTIILLQNNDNRTGKERLPIDETRSILYQLPIKKDLRLSDELLEKYAGVYLSETGKDVEIKFKNHALWVNNDFDLIPISEIKFKVNGFRPEVTYTFSINEQGLVENYRMEQLKNGVDKTSIRKK